MERIIEITNINNRTSAYDVILDNGFTDVLPDVNFYEKMYKKDGKYYFFNGWNLKIDKRHRVTDRPSVYMREREY